MPEQPTVSPFSRPPVSAARTFTRPVPRPTTTSVPRTLVTPKPAKAASASTDNLPMGFLAGLVAAGFGAAAWAGVTLATGYQIGWMAVGVGCLVGWAVRAGGKGTHATFGLLGALLALGGCAAGNLLAVIIMAARHFDVALLDVFSRLTPETMLGLMQASFKPIDLLFYGIALYEGWKFSIVAR
jgi:hypothetical protein